MKNQEVVRILSGIADILEIQEVQFKPQAYRKAAIVIESLAEDVEDIYRLKGIGGLEEISGVGEHIAAKIEEIIKTGKLQYYEALKKEIDVDIESLNAISGLGPKKIKILYQRLNVRTVADLERVLKSHKVRELEGFGEKTEEVLLQSIEFFKTKPKRFLYAQAVPVVAMIYRELGKYDFVDKLEVAGSFVRGKETVGDLDFLVVSRESTRVMEAFVKLPDVKEVLVRGNTKSSIRLANGLQIDLRVVGSKEFGSAMNYFIGNKEHNVALRKLALSRGLTLSEYGLFRLKGKKWVAGRSEDEIYQKLGLSFIDPALRENHGEIEAARIGALPTLVKPSDVNGVFHNHSHWSDGNNTLLLMAQRAEELGFKFISFNDHFGPIGITNPLNEKRLLGYLKEIEGVRKKVGIRVFSGVEVDILKDGSLPLSPSLLKKLDVVIASVHLSMKMPEPAMTRRICSAMEKYPIHILGHLTNRLLNTREGVALNYEKVFETAATQGVFLEINALPQRMELQGEQIKQAKERGCLFALGTDAHDVNHLPFYTFGVNMARRGWLEKKDLLNCWSLPKIEKALRK